jgi:probable O-glycosylation ligase (exosortase A-associated)
MMNEENEYALALVMGVSLLMVLARGEPRRWLRISMYAMGLGCGLTVVGTHSRSGILGLAAAALLLTFYSRHKVLGIVVVIVAAIAIFAFGPKEAVQRYETINSKVTETDESVIGRLQAWETAFAMTKAHPLFGVGPLNFVYQFPYYSAYKPRAPHSAYIGLMAESGIPAMLTFVALLLSAVWQMWKLRRQLMRYASTARLGIYCLAIQVTLLVYMVPNFFINRQNQDLMYHLIGISAGLAILAKQRVKELRADEQRVLVQRFNPSEEAEPVNA